MELQTYLEQKYRPATAEAYLREIQIYTSNCKGAETANNNMVMDYLGSIRKRYDNPATVNRILASIKSYYEYLVQEKVRKDNPARSIILKNKISRDVQLQDLFTPEELEKLLDRQGRFGLLYYRNRVMVSFFIYQGLQLQSVAELKTTDINLEIGNVYVRSTSLTNSRTLPLRPNQVMMIHEYMTIARPKLLKGTTSDHLLIGSRQKPVNADDISSYFKYNYKGVHGERRINAQTIRQSVITNLLKQGHDLRIVQSFAGHKYPGTTERYKQASVEALKSAIEQYHPISENTDHDTDL